MTTLEGRYIADRLASNGKPKEGCMGFFFLEKSLRIGPVLCLYPSRLEGDGYMELVKENGLYDSNIDIINQPLRTCWCTMLR
jgi:hypothetical protein